MLELFEIPVLLSMDVLYGQTDGRMKSKYNQASEARRCQIKLYPALQRLNYNLSLVHSDAYLGMFTPHYPTDRTPLYPTDRTPLYPTEKQTSIMRMKKTTQITQRL